MLRLCGTFDNAEFDGILKLRAFQHPTIPSLFSVVATGYEGVVMNVCAESEFIFDSVSAATIRRVDGTDYPFEANVGQDRELYRAPEDELLIARDQEVLDERFAGRIFS
jgi:hypothetical protein